GMQILDGQINPSAFGILLDVTNDIGELECQAQVPRIALHTSVIRPKDRQASQTNYGGHTVTILCQLGKRSVALDREVHLHTADQFLKVMLRNSIMRHGALEGLGDTMGRLPSVAIIELLAPVLQHGVLGRQNRVVIGNIVAVATEGVHCINSVTLGLGQKKKRIVKILRVSSRHFSTVRICLLCVWVHMWLLVLPPAALIMLPLTAGAAASCKVHDTSRAAVYCRKSCLLTQGCLQELQPCSGPVASWERRCCLGSIGHGSAAQVLNHLLDLRRRSRGRQWRSKGYGDR